MIEVTLADASHCKPSEHAIHPQLLSLVIFSKNPMFEKKRGVLKELRIYYMISLVPRLRVAIAESEREKR